MQWPYYWRMRSTHLAEITAHERQWVCPQLLRGPTLPNALCCPGFGENLGNIIHNQLKSTVYPVLASVHGLGQGELEQCPVCVWVQQVSSRSQFSHPPPLCFMYYPSSTQVFFLPLFRNPVCGVPAYLLASYAQRLFPLWL